MKLNAALFTHQLKSAAEFRPFGNDLHLIHVNATKREWVSILRHGITADGLLLTASTYVTSGILWGSVIKGRGLLSSQFAHRVMKARERDWNETSITHKQLEKNKTKQNLMHRFIYTHLACISEQWLTEDKKISEHFILNFEPWPQCILTCLQMIIQLRLALRNWAYNCNIH